MSKEMEIQSKQQHLNPHLAHWTQDNFDQSNKKYALFTRKFVIILYLIIICWNFQNKKIVVPNYKLQIILIIVHYYAEATEILWYPRCDVTFLQNVAMITTYEMAKFRCG